MPDPVRRSDIQLDYPYVTPTHTINLRAPDFGNVERLGFTRISRKTRGGDIKFYAHPNWPKEDILTFTITGITEAQRDALKTFLKLSLGKDIKLRDHEDFTWKGIILTPNNEFTAIRKVCNATEEEYGFTFEFQGELQ